MAKNGGNINVAGVQKMQSNMESPLNAQKDSAEAGPAAPSGLPTFEPTDPLGLAPGKQGSKPNREQ